MYFRLIFCLICTFFAFKIQAQTALELKDMCGQWYIQYTDFPRWLKGDRTNPRFEYGLGERKGKKGLTDTVLALKKGKETRLLGFDTPIDSLNRTFEWRGNGLLSLLKSRWTWLHIDTENGWGLIYFSKTAFTPAGYDVISREKNLSGKARAHILNHLEQLNIRHLIPLHP